MLFMKPGLNYGVDFKGGIQVEVRPRGRPISRNCAPRSATLGVGEVGLQQFGGDSTC